MRGRQTRRFIESKIRQGERGKRGARRWCPQGGHMNVTRLSRVIRVVALWSDAACPLRIVRAMEFSGPGAEAGYIPARREGRLVNQTGFRRHVCGPGPLSGGPA